MEFHTLEGMKLFNFQLFLVFVVIQFVGCGKSLPQDLQIAYQNLPEIVDYNYHIKPILSDRCYKCHGPDANQRKANYRLDIEEHAFSAVNGSASQTRFNIKAGKISDSELINRIVSDNAEYMMPPPESNLVLSIDEKAMIAKWIKQGAKYKTHWAFVPPIKEDLSPPKNKNWSKNEIDNFILHRIERQGLEVSEKASKATLFRRITLDLTGLPPTPEAIERFLANDNPNSYEKEIDRLMSTKQYGERMAVEWMDVARYADTHGYQDDGMRNTWPWRDWVIQSFNDNMPYDQFITEQLAGDLLTDPSKDQLLATCFNRNHPQTQEGGVVEEEYRVEYVADRTNTFGKALMGITLECARCHDHKYDPISQKEYYELSAFFNSNNDSGIVPYNGEATPTVMLPTASEDKKLDSLQRLIHPLEGDIVSENYLADLETWMTNNGSVVDIDNGLVAYFDFEEELEVPKSSLNLDNKKGAGWAGIGNKDKTFSYHNVVKQKADAAIFGDKDTRPQLNQGKEGNGLLFNGDCGVRFNRDMDYDRNQPFSVSIWVKLLSEGEKGPIFNNTNGDFEGYRGWICKLNEDGTLSFQLNHVWPDNAIDYQTTDKVKLGKWTHIAIAYDGSSKANGLKIYIDGKTPELILHKDNLQKSLLHGVNGSNWSNYPLMLGKEKERSIQDIVMDEFRVYNRQISEIEVKHLFENLSGTNYSEDQLLQHYLLSGQNEKFNKSLGRLTELRKEENLISTDVLEVMIMTDRNEVRPTYVLDRGMYDAPREEVTPNTPSIFSRMSDKTANNRLALSKWLVSEENPLTARVQVNRLWAMLFGKGLVATQEDFGNQGNLPSHPELMDWLAVDFMENDWDMKRMLKKILMSATYQQLSIAQPASLLQDPTNIFYSYFPAHRLSAEMIRDNALAASGLLSTKIGGPSVYPYQPDGIWKALATRNATEYNQGIGEELYRRSLYTVWKRSAPPPSMMNFDAPDRYNCVVNRQKTSTPLQSLVLMNDPQYVEAARVLAERAYSEAETNLKNKIDFIFRCLVGRAAQEEEIVPLEELYKEVLSDFQEHQNKAIELLHIGEREFDKSLNVAELSALTIISSTVMNYDEFVMKR